MTVGDRIRALVEQGDGRVAIERVVSEALGVAGARGDLARRLVTAAVADLRGLAVEGDDVVTRAAAPRGCRTLSAALTSPASFAALPALVATCEVTNAGPAERGAGAFAFGGPAWRETLGRLAAETAGTVVLALSAAPVRRVLRTAAIASGLDPDQEPVVVALGRVARIAGSPVATAEQAAGLVGAPVPESPEQAARLLANLGLLLAERTGVPVHELGGVADRDLAPEFDFGARLFGRAELLALPEAPGVYILEDAEGDVAYVGKGANLRRRVASYFQSKVDERAARVRDAAHLLTFERTGTELSALLREQELILELCPTLNVQEGVHARGRPLPAGLAGASSVAVVQPSADGGAEIVLLDATRGVRVGVVAPAAEEAHERAAIEQLVRDLRRMPESRARTPAVEIALTWLAESGQDASVMDASGAPAEVAELACRLARDAGLSDGRIVTLAGRPRGAP